MKVEELFFGFFFLVHQIPHMLSQTYLSRLYWWKALDHLQTLQFVVFSGYFKEAYAYLDSISIHGE